MHVLVGGKAIKLPGSGLVWQKEHSSPNARCVWWLYITGWAGGVWSAGLSGTSLVAFAVAVDCCAFALGACNSNAAYIKAVANPATKTIRSLRTHTPPTLATHANELFSNRYDLLLAFFATTSSRLVPKSLRITVAAFRPGIPVTAPPGAVQAPV
jgi:hypothetical protein